MLAVSTESLAVLSAALAARVRADWVLYTALLPFVLGLAVYAGVIARFDLRQLVVGKGDHWITGGALAIAALAAADLSLATRSLHQPVAVADTLSAASLVLWWVAFGWLPVLLAVEALRPRLSYDARRWASVFPVGMYAACSFVVGATAHASGITEFARIWVWAGLALWTVVCAATARRGARLARGDF
jgi:hypothetical protein